MRPPRLAPLLAGLLLAGGCACSSPEPAETSAARDAAEQEAVARLEAVLAAGEAAEEKDYALLWRLASAQLKLVDRPATPDDERLPRAEAALEHATAATKLRPEAVEGQFYRAIATGRVLEHSTLPNPGKIDTLEEAGLAAREADPAFRCAGPLRLLALFYSKAPPWPLGPELAGEEREIDSLFAEALRLAPDCPQNQQAYAEFLLDCGRNGGARRRARAARRLLAGGHAHLEPWEHADLERRNQDLLEALSGCPPPELERK